MKKPDLKMLAQWLDPAIVATLETRRKMNGTGVVSWQRYKLCG